MIYYTADLHLGHYNILKYDKRPFNSTQEMDKTIIDNWNNRVTDNDDVYIIGDVCFGNNPENYIKQLKGKKHLIIGNHDKEVLKRCRSYFVSVDYYKKIYDNNKAIILCHYPMAEWDGMFRESYHIYGHIHNALNDTYYMMKNRDLAFNAGCMINNYMPVTLNELITNNNNFKREH